MSLRLVGCTLLAVQTALLAWSAGRHSPTHDEVGHLPGGIAIWHFGRFDLYRVNPPLVRAVAAVPVTLTRPETDWSRFTDAAGARPEWAVGADFIEANGERAFPLFMYARWACIPLVLLGGWLCWRWAGELYGATAGLVALALWSFSPNVLGNGWMLTPDTAAASLGLLAAYTFRNWLAQQSWITAFKAGISLGLAELTKITWILLFALWPAIALFCRRTPRPQERRGLVPPNRSNRSRTLDWAGQLAAILLTGLYVLNLGYAFDGSFRRLDSYEFFSRMLAGDETRSRHSGQPGNRFEGSWLGAIPVPLPKDYLTGIDLQKQDFEQGRWSYLAGAYRKDGGWWHYYLCAAAVKLPLGTWLLTAVALVITLSGTRPIGLPEALPLIAPPVAVLVLVSSETGFSRYFRYVLPALPFLFVWISQTAILWRRTGPSLFRSGCGLLVGAAVLWSVLSSLLCYPHNTSFFNELAGGPRGGDRYLIDANVDWGQDLFFLREWIATHPDSRPLTVTYDGAFDEKLASVAFPRAADVPQTGWHAISVNQLRDISRRYAYFLSDEPVAYAGYSIRVYHFRAERTGSNR